MHIRQLTIFLDNRPGRLQSVTSILAKKNINLRALSIADSTDFGLLRIIVDQPDKAHETLEKDGFVVKVNDVLAIKIGDHPGGLQEILEPLTEAEINIEYIYGYATKSEIAVILFKTDDNQKAKKILEKASKPLLNEKELFKL